MRASSILLDPGYAALKQYIVDRTGLAYYADKDEDLASRIGRRFASEGVRNCSAYLASLLDGRAGAREMEGLVGELTIGETYFFRQRAHFDALRDTIFPNLLERNKSTRRLQVWSAGCATGAEPYSIAMLLRLEMADRIADWDISILGTDINVEFLARARQARFDNWAFREVPEDVKARCFDRQGSQWALRPEFRTAVKFEQHNLVAGAPAAGPPGGPFDLILCRNVMIYFDAERVRRTVAKFYDSLAEGGWLLVGHAEPNQETFRQFRTVSFAQVTAYRKAGAGAPPDVPAAPQWKFGPNEPGEALRGPSARESFTDGPRPAIAASAAGPTEVPAVTVENARALADRGQWNDAAALCRKLIAADALNAVAHFTLGLILEHGASPEEAVRELRRAVYLDRGFVLGHYHLGTCLQGAGQPQQARKAFTNAIQLLAGKPDGEVLAHGDGITVAELRDLSTMHLELLGGL